MNDPLAVFVAMGACAGGVAYIASAKDLGRTAWIGWLLGTCSLACGVTLMVLAVGA